MTNQAATGGVPNRTILGDGTVLAPLTEAAYRLWARQRLPVTGRPGLEQLCQERQAGGPAAATTESRCRT